MKEPSQDRQQPIDTNPPEGPKRWTIHYTQLRPLHLDNPLYREGEFYRREVGRLLAEGHEGKFILVKGEEIIGLFDTLEEAMNTGHSRYTSQPFLVRQVLTWECVIQAGWMWRPHAASCVPNNW